MSWLFGKKKHKESPVDLCEEPSTSNQSDDYIIIERQANPFTPNVELTNKSDNVSFTGGSSGLYPHLGNVMKNPPPLPTSSLSFEQQQNILGDTQTYLNAIPFQLNKQFNDNNEINRIHIDEIFSYLLRIKNEDYNYDFGLEKSVIMEIQPTAK